MSSRRFGSSSTQDSSIEDVAARFGVTPTVVATAPEAREREPKFIALYREGEITLEHLMAFAVTDDHE